MLRKLRYALEVIILFPGLVFFRLLPLDVASALAGLIGQLIGPFTRAHRTARMNIERSLPHLSIAERKRILSKMWNNLGRVIGEYPHLSRPIMAQRITIEGREHVEVVKASGKGSMFVSGHFANWEIAPLTAHLCGLPLVLIYRAANNPVADWIIRSIRSHYNRAMYGKGRDGATQALKALKEKQAVGMLVDQKMNDGSPVPFFGRDAMTATAVASIAIKQQVPLLTARVVRTDGAHFHVTVIPPIMYDESTDAIAAMTDINRLFEGWIREHPEQWFWVHNRWGEK